MVLGDSVNLDSKLLKEMASSTKVSKLKILDSSLDILSFCSSQKIDLDYKKPKRYQL